MRAKLRLRFLIPLVVVAVGGLGFAKVGLGPLETGVEDEPAAAAPSTIAGPAAAPAATAPAGEDGPAGEPPAGEPVAAAEPVATGETRLAAALEESKVVVLVVYAPGAAVDTLVIREARLAAKEVGAGFVAVNAAREKQIEDLAVAYELRDTPAVLVFERGPEVVKRFVGFTDRQTIAQAAQDAR